MALSGIWLPIITPFVDGAVDLKSYERMLTHYLGTGVTGIFPLGTTGESPTVDDDEMEAIVDRTVSVVAGRVPVFVGIGGNATAKVRARRGCGSTSRASPRRPTSRS
jgi:4-hydroxy-tetrahydrodipicolinate synthase